MRPNNSALRLFWTAAIAVLSVSCSKDMAEAEKMNRVPENAPGLYSFDIAAGKADATRAILDQSDYKYYWETGDQMGLIIVPSGSYTPIDPGDSVIIMTNNHADKIEHTTFSGELTQTQIDAVSSLNTYDYYSYFPYGSGTVGTLPDILFTIPSTLSLEPNVFNSDYAPMVAEVEPSQPPIVYLNGQELVHGSLIHFDYKHVMSYAAIEMDVNLLPQTQTVTSITITNTSGTLISGAYNYNMKTGSAGYVSGSNSITIDIPKGLKVGDGSVLYVPMPPVNMEGQNFILTFKTGSYSKNKYENVTTVYGINFVKGKIHRLRVAPAATYTETTSFTVTKNGYYYIETWGGDGGNSVCGSYGTALGGKGGEKRGLFYFTAGTSIELHVGMKGANAGDRRSNAQGGASGIGHGGNGARGGDEVSSGNYGYASGGGGGASGIKINNDVYLAAGGGSGGAGTADHSNSGNRNPNVWNGSPGSDNDQSANPSGGNGNSTTVSNGAGGNDGFGGNLLTGYNGGGGGSGGGGGYPRGGFGGGGGQNIGNATGNRDPRGGAGGGGMNYVYGTAANTPGYTFPFNSRPSEQTDGYVVITFLR